MLSNELNGGTGCVWLVPLPAQPYPRFDKLVRVLEILLGLIGGGFAIVVLANPFVSARTLVPLLGLALAADGLRAIISGGGTQQWWRRVRNDLQSTISWLRRVGLVAIGATVVILVVAALLNLQLGELTILYLLASGVIILSVGRIIHAYGHETPGWLQISSVGTGVIAIALVSVALAYPTVGVATLAILLAVSMLVNGVQSVVWGLRPTDPRQIVLLKLVLFSLFYGLVLINWIDLFGKSVPAYGIWLILTYFAPFVVLLVYEGVSEWPLALSLGLLVSLANDVGYYFVGNLLFGFHQNLGVWIAGQLGLGGSELVTIFDAGSVWINVYSWEMGLSIYLRAIIVSVGLYYWWRHPSRIVARLPTDVPA